MRIRSRIAACLAAMLATTMLSANAAKIDYVKSTGTSLAGIIITGEIVTGDADHFKTLINAIPEKNPTISLQSPGGIMIEGLMIGQTIHEHGLTTYAWGQCASACGLIWLAGMPRWVDNHSLVGFHAIYTGASNPTVSPNGNALVGAYLNNLGLSYAAVNYITSAPPQGMKWLSWVDAQRVGIHYTDITDESTHTEAAPAPVVPAAPAVTPPPATIAPQVALPRSPEQIASDELNAWLNASELRLREKVGDAKVDAVKLWATAELAKDPTFFQRARAQPDPYAWLYQHYASASRTTGRSAASGHTTARPPS